MEVDVTKLAFMRPWPKGKKIRITPNSFYLMSLIGFESTHKVLQCVFAFAEYRGVFFDLDKAELMLFVNILIDSNAIDIDLKNQEYPIK